MLSLASSSNQVVVAMTGASGSAYAIRLIQILLRSGAGVHFIASGASRQVLLRELECRLPPDAADIGEWGEFFETALDAGPAASWGFRTLSMPRAVNVEFQSHSVSNYSAGIASGSFRTRGMVVVPCSMGTLSSIACGASTNLIQRAADVHLKERRPLIVVPRETPLSVIALENMTRLCAAGATIMPAMPGYYHQPQTIGDLVDFVVARICDHLQVSHGLVRPWGSDPELSVSD